ncbi:sugar transferase [Brevibacillus daliensis]|uniref:sugar transferase n=1 Tax=Brevibacillus daliensis TaxID=2892995 RepID=UPI001E29BEBC|nr:sugar transferase [Brevibacillus daliensis]
MERTIKMRIITLFQLTFDLFFVYASFILTFSTYWHQGTNNIAKFFPLGLLVPLLVFYLFGIYSEDHYKNTGSVTSSTFVSILFSQLSIFLYLDIYPVSDFSFSDFLLTTFFQMFFIVCLHVLFHWLYQNLFLNKKALIFAENQGLSKDIQHKLSSHYLKLNTKWIIPTKKEEWDNHVKESDVVIISSKMKEKNDVICSAMDHGKQVLLIPEAQDLSIFHAEVKHINDLLLFLIRPPRLSSLQMLVKRIFDVIISSLLLIMCSPVLFILYILIPLTSKGPAIYKQERTGLSNKTFQIYKLRSMLVHAEDRSGPVLATKNDPRITKIGKFLRSTRLDELPQLFNVVKGDMSLVGPRPERPFFVNQFNDSIKGYTYRANVKPGITGLAQIMGKYSSTAEEKLRFDLLYVFGYSWVLDFKILCQTVYILLQRESAKGIETVNENINA